MESAQPALFVDGVRMRGQELCDRPALAYGVEDAAAACGGGRSRRRCRRRCLALIVIVEEEGRIGLLDELNVLAHRIFHCDALWAKRGIGHTPHLVLGFADASGWHAGRRPLLCNCEEPEQPALCSFRELDRPWPRLVDVAHGSQKLLKKLP